MRVLLGSTPHRIRGDRSRPLIQNLGPGNVYLDTDGDVDADSGFEIAPGAVYEFGVSGGTQQMFIVADQPNTDVRIIEIG